PSMVPASRWAARCWRSWRTTSRRTVPFESPRCCKTTWADWTSSARTEIAPRHPVDYLPIFYSIKDQPCLVVGGGEVALRKTEALLKAFARVRVVAPSIDPALRSLVEPTGGTCAARDVAADDVQDMRLVIAATDDEAVNRAVSLAATAQGCLINVVDNPQLSNFITPAIIDRDPLVIAISSGGKAPVLARQLRARIETLVPA